jgi:heme/copper-type cytochrome/quinol oxidase subunit 4
MIAVICSVVAVMLVVIGGLWICLSMAAREDSRWGDK